MRPGRFVPAWIRTYSLYALYCPGTVWAWNKLLIPVTCPAVKRRYYLALNGNCCASIVTLLSYPGSPEEYTYTVKMLAGPERVMSFFDAVSCRQRVSFLGVCFMTRYLKL